MANLTNKYLDFGGLESFWNKAKTYITNEILDIDGTKILLNNDDNDSHSITYEISEIWKVLGGGTPGEGSGNLSQDVSTILGAYVKSFKGVDGEYIKIGPSAKSNGPTDIVLTLDETALKQKLTEIEGKSGVTGFQASGSNGISVTGADTSQTGNVSISIDGQGLKSYAESQAAEAKAYTDTVIGEYSDGEKPATGIRQEISNIDSRLTQSINTEITARKSKDALLAGSNWDSDNAAWKENLTPKYPNITSLSGVLEEHDGKINLLTSATQFKGIDYTIEEGADVDYTKYRVGDIILNGPKEYIADIEVNSGGTGKWILLGDVTAESAIISDIIHWVNNTRIRKDQIQSLFADVSNQTISFTIDGVPYTASSGMTWGEWIVDVSGGVFTVFINQIYMNGTPISSDESLNRIVLDSDMIIENHSYTTLLTEPINL